MSLRTVIWVDVELLEGHHQHDLDMVQAAFRDVVSGGGGVVTEPEALSDLARVGAARPVVLAVFEEAAPAVEAAVLGQWGVQKSEPHPGVKVRIGVHGAAEVAGAARGAAALCAAANGNQILVSGAVDVATGGMLDARPMGTAILPGEDVPTQLWLMTDSRPDVDRRPLRTPLLGESELLGESGLLGESELLGDSGHPGE